MMEDLSDLPVAIEEASKLMGIRGFTDSPDDAAFASDALRIEVTGPTGLQLSIVDLPGLISVSNEEQSQADVDAVHAMVRSYLRSTRTIILAVVQASNDFANQGIIKIAREYDPDGQRTVGIITKPDLINVGAEAKLSNIAKNKDAIKLKLGFFLLKNPSPSEMQADSANISRAEREMNFFSSPAWKAQNLDMSRVGIENLKAFLQELLDEHLEGELPKLKDEVRRALNTLEKELDDMGPERRSLGDIRSFMTNLSMRYYQLAQAALDGNYHCSDAAFFDKKNGSRLRSLVHQRNGVFATKIRAQGHKRKITDSPPTPVSDGDLGCDCDGDQLVVTRSEMISWIWETYNETRGRELPGNYSHILLAELFHEHSSPWRKLAEEHVSAVLENVSKWIQQAVSTLFHEDRLRRDINSFCQEQLELSRKTAFKELEQIILDENRHPITYNHYYTENIQKARNDSQKELLESSLAMIGGGTFHVGHPDDRKRLIGGLQPRLCVDMDQQACEEALAGLNAYYKVAMKTFVDNICRQVVERHILAPLPEIFNPTTVSQLSDDELLRIGSEPEKEIARRQRLGASAQGLRSSLLELQCLSVKYFHSPSWASLLSTPPWITLFPALDLWGHKEFPGSGKRSQLPVTHSPDPDPSARVAHPRVRSLVASKTVNWRLGLLDSSGGSAIRMGTLHSGRPKKGAHDRDLPTAGVSTVYAFPRICVAVGGSPGRRIPPLSLTLVTPKSNFGTPCPTPALALSRRASRQCSARHGIRRGGPMGGGRGRINVARESCLTDANWA
ncbi:vacuolar sorting protein VPS1 [Colletotrichum orchidophilum]|uniref:Vacuolar sorting protein VPS1 n=1 Tax=Colletotrichum orchidophilum TaxID=1209926 RepID=A0A1G4AT31_9PEZI|nr:vacuolar sorting protein VPS1 [Colletotrichum orchidophilum]OHE92329.1 vacuolar sorting protein VPS1 [Colletotrichum orchidophilum]